MAVILPFPVPESESIIFNNIPDDAPVALVTGYTDLRKSISGLTSIIELDYATNPRSLCLFLFAGRSASRFKGLLPEGDGFLLLQKQFFSKRLVWPRVGGKTNGELWWLSREQYSELMSGRKMTVTEGEEDEIVPEPILSRLSNTLYANFLKTDIEPKAVYVITGFTDLRKSISGLSRVITSFGKNIDDGGIFLFCGRCKDKAKMVCRDGDGYVLLTKQLFEGRYQWPSEEGEMWEISFTNLFPLLTQSALPRSRAFGITKRGAN